jgi:adenine deaminase
MVKPPGRLIPDAETRYDLARVALGEAEADLALVGGTVVNVYIGELLSGETVLIKGDRIAYVGKDAARSIGPRTRVIDATNKTLIPGFIDGHTHADYIYPVAELVRYAMMGGTTTIITEASMLVFPLGYFGITEFMRSTQGQPIKFFITVPPMVTINPAASKHAIQVGELRRLLRKREVLGLGEVYWAPATKGDPRVLELITETRKQSGNIEGHTAGARGNKLQAYVSLGVSSCHEPITADEVKERLQAGLTVFIREGVTRSDLEVIAKIKNENIDFRYLALASDGLSPEQLVKRGYMEFLVQKAIQLGFDPVRAIQMATINVAQHFNLGDAVGGIAPGRFADISIIPDLDTIIPECVISNGQVVAQDSDLLVAPRQHRYSKSALSSVHLPSEFTARDFAVPVKDDHDHIKVRVIDIVTDLITREALIDLPVTNGQVQLDIGQDALKIATVERVHQPGQTFIGFVRGTGIKYGAIASSLAIDSWDIVVVGASEADMAQAVNRVRELSGGVVVCADSQVLAELPCPVGGVISPESIGVIADKLDRIQKAVAKLGCILPDVGKTLAFLTSESVPFLRICEHGLIDVRQNSFVDLVVT